PLGTSDGILAVLEGATCVAAGLGPQTHCIGSPKSGVMGADPNSPNSNVFVPSNTLPGGVIDLSGRMHHLCAKTTLDAVYCWGRSDGEDLSNRGGESLLCPDDYNCSPTPQDVGLPRAALRISAGRRLSFAWLDGR